MRFVSTLVICAGMFASLGCGGGGGKAEIKELTPEEIQQQKDNEKQVQTEESQHRKSMPKEKTPEQIVEAQERNRHR